MDDKTRKFNLFLPCFFSFFVNGAMVLMLGAVLPYIIEEAGMSYSVAGGLLSAFAIGNLLASFVNPPMAARIGRKGTIVLFSSMIPVMWFVISLLPSIPVMYLAIVVLGIGRGSVSIINNAVVNDNAENKASALSLLHMTFAVGAFISPFLTSVFISNGLGWRAIVYTTVAATTCTAILYALMKIDYNWPKESAKAKELAGKSDNNNTDKNSPKADNGDKSFYRNPLFYIVGILLFLYLGLENCVNGWFVTYFKGMGIMSPSYAANLVSITWIMVMIGRLFTAKMSKKVDKNILIMAYCIATAMFFGLLVATSNLAVITVAIVGLGFFFAGIYPTCVAAVGSVIKGNNTGMSMFLAIAALGGIITPKLVGVIADGAGMQVGVLILMVNVVGMLLLSFVNIKYSKKFGA